MNWFRDIFQCLDAKVLKTNFDGFLDVVVGRARDQDPAGFCNRGLYFAKSLDGGDTWTNARGTASVSLAFGPITYDDPAFQVVGPQRNVSRLTRAACRPNLVASPHRRSSHHPHRVPGTDTSCGLRAPAGPGRRARLRR